MRKLRLRQLNLLFQTHMANERQSWKWNTNFLPPNPVLFPLFPVSHNCSYSHYGGCYWLVAHCCLEFVLLYRFGGRDRTSFVSLMVCNACCRALEIGSARGMEADWSIYLPQYTGLCLWGTLHLFLAEVSTRVPWTGRHGSKHLARRAVSMAGNQVTTKPGQPVPQQRSATPRNVTWHRRHLLCIGHAGLCAIPLSGGPEQLYTLIS